MVTRLKYTLVDAKVDGNCRGSLARGRMKEDSMWWLALSLVKEVIKQPEGQAEGSFFGVVVFVRSTKYQTMVLVWAKSCQCYREFT